MAKDNLVLAHLPRQVREQLRPRLERVRLPRGQTLVEPGQPIRALVFPTSGLVSLLGITRTGATVELATVAKEGVVGLPGLEPDGARYFATVQVSGAAWSLRTDGLEAELRANIALREALYVYGRQLLAEISQAVICQCYHLVPDRLCRWLLTATDRLGTDAIDMTQEELGHALGVLRPGITRAALDLQNAHAIHVRYGRIVILNRAMLERSSCECYQTLRSGRPRSVTAMPARRRLAR